MTQDSINAQDAQLANRLIADARRHVSLAARLKFLSSRFLGLPYIVGPLIGSPSEPERFVVRFDGFDCVTYVETVLALALARNADEFATNLREIRYENGQVEWRRRLHYTSDWAAYQIRRGLLREMSNLDGSVVRDKTLGFVRGLPARPVSLRYYPKEQFAYVSRWLTDGDLAYFLSTRRDLDVFHIGFVFREGDRLLIRHARHMRHRVLEQPLAEFVKAVKSPGFIINRLAKD
jgi:hypothetical protein